MSSSRVYVSLFCFLTKSDDNIKVGHIPYEARERDVERFFKGYGRIRDILIKVYNLQYLLTGPTYVITSNNFQKECNI